ncbi:DUF4430 domain-containing protein [Oceanobacillus senegalensis]|uniref:DUF4430 domain-containing protein n=1 Tax=Oceanobacillus senegalensis TaxID=1936063 RepID=UPI000A3126DB|nr:DUF4430 domain-containing protein [Oceanobacillus senegalensis]
MKKWNGLIIVSIMIISIGLLAGCSFGEETEDNGASTSTTDSTHSTEVPENHVRITVSINHGNEFITEEEIPIEDGDILLDVMEENFYVEQKGGFITSIERVKASDEEKTAWMYYVNGEMPTVGASEYELSSGDKIVFDLQSWE